MGVVFLTKEDFNRQIFHFNPELFWMTFLGSQGPKQVSVAELEHWK